MIKEKYTKAGIDGNTLFWLFGVEMGFVDCSISNMDDLEAAVDAAYTKQQIIDLTLNPA